MTIVHLFYKYSARFPHPHRTTMNSHIFDIQPLHRFSGSNAAIRRPRVSIFLLIFTTRDRLTRVTGNRILLLRWRAQLPSWRILDEILLPTATVATTSRSKRRVWDISEAEWCAGWAFGCPFGYDCSVGTEYGEEMRSGYCYLEGDDDEGVHSCVVGVPSELLMLSRTDNDGAFWYAEWVCLDLNEEKARWLTGARFEMNATYFQVSNFFCPLSTSSTDSQFAQGTM